MDVQDTTSSTEAFVPAAKVDGPDTILAQHRGAHDTWLDSNVKVRLSQNGDRVLGENAGEGNEFGMPRAIQCPIRFVHSSANDLAIFDEDTADGRLITDQRQLCL